MGFGLALIPFLVVTVLGALNPNARPAAEVALHQIARVLLIWVELGLLLLAIAAIRWLVREAPPAPSSKK